MKKIFLILTILLLVTLVGCGKDNPDEQNNLEDLENNYYDTSIFEGIDESDVSVFDYDDSFGRITIKGFASDVYPEIVRIPSIIDGKEVTAIRSGAFQYSDNLKVIIIPDSVIGLYGSTFMACPNLIAVKLPSNLEYLGSTEFSASNKLTSIYLPASLNSIPGMAFYDSSISKIYVESGSFAEQWCNENGYSKNVIVQKQ